MQAQHHAMSSLYRTTPHYVGDSTAADMDADPGGVLFGTEAPTSFATTESLSRCAQYLEPILRGNREGVWCFSVTYYDGLQALYTAVGPCIEAHNQMTSRSWSTFGQATTVQTPSSWHLPPPRPFGCGPISDWLATDLGLKQCQLLEGDAVAAINCLYDLVQQHQRMQEGREQVQEQLHKVKVGSIAAWHSEASICVRWCYHIRIGSVLTACKLHVVNLLKLRGAQMVAACFSNVLRHIVFVACLRHAAHGQVDVKVANKTIQRLQGQVEAKEQEVGALNIKVCCI